MLKNLLPKPAKGPAQKPPGKAAVQAWLPVVDVSQGMLVRRDGSLAAVIRIEAAPFALLSERERERRIAAMREVIQMIPGQAQIVAVPRPIDLDAYLTSLDALATEAVGPRRSLLRGYLGYVRGLATSAGATERRYYILLPGERGRKESRDELAAKARDMVAALARADLQARICSDQEELDLLYVWLNPAQAAFERPSLPGAIAPVYLSAKEVATHGTS
ncbi:MAG: TraC family protein [Syntrophomonadaceae bacterium]|nr:TraC family protein [Syntrophomonadaceae bacterium]